MEDFLADENVINKGGIDSADIDSKISHYSSENKRISLERQQIEENGGASLSAEQR